MSRGRAVAAAVAGLRMAYGVALAVAPGAVGSKWIGRDARRRTTGVALRALGTRDAALQAGTLAAALRGEPVRPWLLAAIAGDVTDMVATAGASGDVPDDAPRKTLAVAGGSAAVSGLLAAALDR
jgi:hypothetical protein